MKKVLHLLSAGGAGGIEMLCEQIGLRGKERHEFCFLFGMGEIAERMKKEGITVHDLSMVPKSSKAKELLSLAKKGNYDAVVVHNEGFGIYYLYLQLVRKNKGPKYIKYLHCSFEDKYFYTGNFIKDKLHYKLLRDCLNRSDEIIAVSEFTGRTYIDEMGIMPDKVKVVYNGIEMPDNEPAGEKSAEAGNLLYIGRLVQEKGVDVLLDALGILKGNEKLHLDVLGDGPMRKALEQKSVDLGITGMVTFHGMRLDKQAFFDKNRIFVYPSVWQEAFGISIIEAMSHGLICVASDVGGIPEIITDDKLGILFEAGNATALANAIKRAIDITESNGVSEYISESKKRAASFSIEKSIEGLERLLK